MKKIVALTVLLIVLAACAKAPPQTVSPKNAVRTGKAALLEEQLVQFAELTKTIKALGWIDLSDGEEERQTDAAIAIERPTSVRVDAMDALADVWAKAGSDGHRLWLSIPSRDKLYSGRASRSNLRRLMQFDWEIGEIVSVVAGSPPVAQGSMLEQVGNLRDNHFVVKGGDVHLWTDPKTGLPIKCARYSNGGNLDFTVIFGDYKRVEKVNFPHRIEATFPERRARITIVYHDVSFGVPIDRRVFLEPHRKGGHVVELESK